MKMLPSTSLRIQKFDGYPDSFGQLWKFTDVYRIDILCGHWSNALNTITLTGVHVPDCHICIPPDVLTLSEKCWISYGKSQKDNNESLRYRFVEELRKSTNNCAGCKRYINGSFIAFPEMFLLNPLVIDSSLIERNQQVVMQICEQSDSAVIGLQSSIRIQHISGVEYSSLRQTALKLGQEIKSLHGNNSVRDKKHHLICALRLDCHLVLMDQCMLLGCMLICIHRNVKIQFITKDQNGCGWK